MSGSSTLRQGLTLTLVFMAVLAAGAVSNAWGGAAATTAESTGEHRAAGGRGTAPSQDEAPSRDPWTAYYTPAEFADYTDALDGRYIGIGVWLRIADDGGFAVSGLQHDGPAERAGVRVGDLLVRVDGRSVADRPVTDVVALLRGTRPGSRVVLGLERPGAGARTLSVRRARLSTEDVTVRDLAGATGTVCLIKVDSFSTGSGAAVARAVRDAERARPADAGVVLDLRGNSGGLLTEARRASSVFLDGGPIARLSGAIGDRTLDAEPGGDTAVPLVVLVDGGTMSAAELLAGALQDRGRAVLVGSRTFGKGSIQAPASHGDDDGEPAWVERTVGHYTTPSGRRVNGVGITPDVSVPVGAEASDAERQALEVLSGLTPRR
ncbi:hypothetical protein BIV57_10350 [Mangrovactinospora gilvigrisea]|uniref:PDZ domain-containing protein n=1 Tax=Mangrovactinospora gilvigrisea TaxID=1428644 RepID=A0A1J7BG14_9ACTN|nr:S41 family peptidase [Mangrovactinospora gilvigrisea]OIV37590.1 hypothetical protein BIV57_10350 [Mangrovactinospora gilvigrisea]